MRPSVKYAAIQQNTGHNSIIEMCTYFEVSRSGYYDWLKKRDFPDPDKELGSLIKKCQEQVKQTYGYRRVKMWLFRETGRVVNEKAILRLMRKYNLAAVIRRPRPLYQRQQQFQVYENMLNRDFKATAPNQKWVTDISYIHTKQGVLYLSMIKDNMIISSLPMMLLLSKTTL